MNKATTLCIAVICCFSVGSARANDDVLTHYNPHSQQVYYNDPNIAAYAARFDVNPCTIEKIVVRLSGATASPAATIRICGHEGGATTPGFQKELLAPFTVEKTEAGPQAITISLPKPLRVENNQVFVIVENLASDVQLISDSEVKESACHPSNGEPLMQQFLRGKDDSWRYGLFGFGIDLLVSQKADTSAPSNLLNVTKSVGINDSLNFRSIAWSDINRDGWQDVLVGGKLYINREGAFSDETEGLGLVSLSDFGFFVDSEKDGYSDILVLSSGVDSAHQDEVVLYHNRGGKFAPAQTFSLAVKAPLCFTVADVNRDSYPDIFIGQGEDASGVLQPDVFLINDTRGGYMLQPMSYQDKHSRTTGSMWVDYNNDALPDLYLVKLNGQYDELWRNNADGTFSNVIDNSFGKRNTTRFGYKIGCDWADYDNDGDIDILQPQQITPAIYTTYQNSGSALLRNTGAPDYTFNTINSSASGIEFEETHAGGSFGDINNDGLLDILLTTSCKCRYADMYIQDKEHHFGMESFQYGLHKLTAGIDAVWVDYNNDGKLDIATGIDGKFALLGNVGTYNNNFVDIELNSTGSQPIGAKVVVYSNTDHYSSVLSSGRGYAMQPSSRLHFGIEKNTVVDSVVVQWPDGHKEVFEEVNVNKNNELREKSGGLTGDISTAITVRAYPNPFAVETVFEYDVEQQSDRVQLEIYTLLGERITTLVDAIQTTGSYKVRWNGNNSSQQKVANGTYLYKINIGGKSYTGNITVEG